MSPVSEARKRANEKYTKANYDEIKVRVPKGKKKIIQQCAMNVGESTTAFINRAIDERIEHDNATSCYMTTTHDTTNVTPEHTPEMPKKHYKPFTEAASQRVDLNRLLIDISYQFTLQDTFGKDVLTTLLEKARQQVASSNPDI